MRSLGRRSPEAEPEDVGALNHWARTAVLWERAMAAGGGQRPNYTWCLLHVAGIARFLGYDRFAALEFGCAGGNGLVALEAAAAHVEAGLGVGVEVHGFDGVGGMPEAEDAYRDGAYVMETGHFPMDVDALRQRLRRTELHLGPVAETVAAFREQDGGAPIGFVVQDLDYWSSTRDALSLYDAPAERFLPRVLSYYDDTLGYPWAEGNGERLANAEFNAARTERRIDLLQGMRHVLPPAQGQERWVDALYLVHVLDHPRYAEYEGTAISTRLDLAPRG